MRPKITRYVAVDPEEVDVCEETKNNVFNSQYGATLGDLKQFVIKSNRRKDKLEAVETISRFGPQAYLVLAEIASEITLEWEIRQKALKEIREPVQRRRKQEFRQKLTSPVNATSASSPEKIQTRATLAEGVKKEEILEHQREFLKTLSAFGEDGLESISNLLNCEELDEDAEQLVLEALKNSTTVTVKDPVIKRHIASLKQMMKRRKTNTRRYSGNNPDESDNNILDGIARKIQFLLNLI
ncbi:hypothetical protein [Halorussus ruber]|uniref:hypothetical protein n=1 Tax=Halorussus ruber TaxID=1126238 RepID=UPI001092A876|nr:hypothetical protein [Halorussus ruber]